MAYGLHDGQNSCSSSYSYSSFRLRRIETPEYEYDDEYEDDF